MDDSRVKTELYRGYRISYYATDKTGSLSAYFFSGGRMDRQFVSVSKEHRHDLDAVVAEAHRAVDEYASDRVAA